MVQQIGLFLEISLGGEEEVKKEEKEGLGVREEEGKREVEESDSDGKKAVETAMTMAVVGGGATEIGGKDNGLLKIGCFSSVWLCFYPPKFVDSSSHYKCVLLEYA